MEQKVNTQNDSRMKQSLSPKSIFTDFTNYASQHEYKSARSKIEVSDSNDALQKSSNIVYCTIKSCEKNQVKDKKPIEDGSQKLPQIDQRKRVHLVTKYFSRNDIFKDKSHQKGHRKSSSVLDVKRSGLSFVLHPDQVTKYKQLFTSSNQHLIDPQLRKNRSVLCLKNNNKVRGNYRQSTLQQQMQEWQILKKKNEYELMKLRRKNDYERMQSNFIITEAMNELVGKKEQIFLEEEFREWSGKFLEMEGNEGCQQMEK